MQANLIKVENLTKHYRMGGNTVVAVGGISFDIAKGEFVVILGPSGCGKSTLLNVLGGMDGATSGKVFIGGKEITAFNEKERNAFRRADVGFVFQFYNLLPSLTVLENVAISSRLNKGSLTAEDALKIVGLEHRKNHFPTELSGGEQQRASIARAMSKNPVLLLCDEPTGALDCKTGKKILAALKEMCGQNGQTVVVVTHNAAIARTADKVISLRDGQIQDITANENPVDPESIDW